MNNEIKRKERKQNELSIQEIEEKIKTLNKEEKIRKYTKGKLLGRGGFAYCYEFVCQDNNKHFAAKVINKENLKQPRQKQKLLIEIKIHKSLHHNQVVAFEHYFEDKENVYILLELCYHQTLNELLKRRKTLSELEVQCYMIQLIKGLQYLHSHKIIHRDLKLGNLFLTDKMELKIGDFGLATKLDYDGEKKRTVCGTPNYIAPEVLDGEHSYEVDVWAIGIIIYTLLIGKPPFEARDLNSTYKNIREINFKWPEHCKVSYCAMKLVKKILVKDPDKRPSASDIMDHPWIKKHYKKRDSHLINRDTLGTLKEFAKKNALQKEIYYFLAKIHNEKEILQLKQLFNEFDTDNSGNLSMVEIRKGFKHLGIEIDEKELEKIWEGLDFHKDGEVNYTEFLAAMISTYKFTKEENLWIVFNYLKENNSKNDYISIENLINMCNSMNLPINEEEIRKNLDGYRPDRLDFDDFKKIMGIEEDD